MEEKTGESVSFFQHVFNFDDDTKSELLNISQYSLLAVVPVVALNKTIQKFIPEADDDKKFRDFSRNCRTNFTYVCVCILY